MPKTRRVDVGLSESDYAVLTARAKSAGMSIAAMALRYMKESMGDAESNNVVRLTIPPAILAQAESNAGGALTVQALLTQYMARGAGVETAMDTATKSLAALAVGTARPTPAPLPSSAVTTTPHPAPPIPPEPAEPQISADKQPVGKAPSLGKRIFKGLWMDRPR